MDEQEAAKHKLQAIMEIDAYFCNHVEFNLTPVGLRMTFGESPNVEGVSPAYRTAVVIPLNLLQGFSDTFNRVLNESRANEPQAQKPN